MMLNRAGNLLRIAGEKIAALDAEATDEEVSSLQKNLEEQELAYNLKKAWFDEKWPAPA